jgi:hypothetical protein
MLATERRANIVSCALLHKSPSETLRMLQGAYGYVSGVYSSVMAVRVLVTIRAAGDRLLRQMTKTWSVCAMVCEVTDERVFRGYQRK